MLHLLALSAYRSAAVKVIILLPAGEDTRPKYSMCIPKSIPELKEDVDLVGFNKIIFKFFQVLIHMMKPQ